LTLILKSQKKKIIKKNTTIAKLKPVLSLTDLKKVIHASIIVMLYI